MKTKRRERRGTHSPGLQTVTEGKRFRILSLLSLDRITSYIETRNRSRGCLQKDIWYTLNACTPDAPHHRSDREQTAQAAPCHAFHPFLLHALTRKMKILLTVYFNEKCWRGIQNGRNWPTTTNLVPKGGLLEFAAQKDSQ